MQLNESEFNDWLQHPATRALKEWCGWQREQMRDAWEKADFTSADFQSTCLVNAKNIGKCECFADIQELDFQTLQGDLHGE